MSLFKGWGGGRGHIVKIILNTRVNLSLITRREGERDIARFF